MKKLNTLIEENLETFQIDVIYALLGYWRLYRPFWWNKDSIPLKLLTNTVQMEQLFNSFKNQPRKHLSIKILTKVRIICIIINRIHDWFLRSDTVN